MLDDFAQSEGLSIKDEIASNKFIDRLSLIVQKQRKDPIRIHGYRIESMFAHIAAALGKSQIITEEDSGVFLALRKIFDAQISDLLPMKVFNY